MDGDEYARLCRELSGDVGRDATDFLRQVNQVERGNAPLIVRAGMAATIAGNVRYQASKLLHFGLSLVARPILQRGAEKCRSANRERDGNTVPENFSQ